MSIWNCFNLCNGKRFAVYCDSVGSLRSVIEAHIQKGNKYNVVATGEDGRSYRFDGVISSVKAVSVRCRAFGGSISDHRVQVDENGEVSVWSPAEGRYTNRHGLQPWVIDQIRKLAC